LRTCPPLAIAVPLLIAMALAACASDGGPADRGPRDSLFLSPAGKPFRAGPGQPYPVSVWFAEADADHDGKLTREELRADFAAFFKTLDVDHDGMIDGIETSRYEEQVAPEVLPRLAQVGGGFPGERIQTLPGVDEPRKAPRRLAEVPLRRGGPSFDGAPEFSLLNVSEPVSSADMNFDGKISLEEYLLAADRRFALLDTEKRGYLTLDTLPQTPEQVVVEGKRKKR
jgi:hypothetical protein